MKSPKHYMISAILIFALLLNVSCSSGGRTPKACGSAVVSLMADMAMCDDYAALFNLPAAYDETIAKLRSGDYSKPSRIYLLTVPEEKLLGLSISDISSDPLADYLRSSACISLASAINQYCGVEALSVSSAYAAQMTFSCPSIDHNCAYLYTFENGVPIVVFRLPGEDDSLRAIGYFLFNEALETDSAAHIEESITKMGIIGVKAKEA